MSNPVGFILTDEELHAADPCPHSMFDQQRLDYGRAVEREVLRKLRERPADAWMRPDNRVAEESYSRTQFSRGPDKPPIGTWRPLHIIPEVNE